MTQRRPKSRALILVDIEPILRRERARCEKLTGDVDELEERVKLHTERDEPAYQAWVHSRHGAELTRMRELQVEYAKLAAFIEVVAKEAEVADCSEREAFEKVMIIRRGQRKMRDNPELLHDLDDLPFEVEQMLDMLFTDFIGEDHGLSDKKLSRMYAKFVREYLPQLSDLNTPGESGEGATDDAETSSDEPPPPRPNRETRRARKDPKTAQNLKSLYHTLARRLHPDLNRNLSARDRELWFEVQRAFERQDVSRLEALVALTESDEGLGLAHVRSVSRLQTILKDLRKKVSTLKRVLKDAQTSPGWQFAETMAHPERRRALEQKTKREIRDLCNLMKVDVGQLNQTVRDWIGGDTRKRGRRSAFSFEDVLDLNS